MFKRFMLALTFVAVFSSAGIGFAPSAKAWRTWGRPYAGYYAPRTVYYGPAVPYRAYYGPRYVPPYYSTYYGGYPVYSDYYYPGYYYRPRSGVSVSFGY
jgi:hypothetical protein